MNGGHGPIPDGRTRVGIRFISGFYGIKGKRKFAYLIRHVIFHLYFRYLFGVLGQPARLSSLRRA